MPLGLTKKFKKCPKFPCPKIGSKNCPRNWPNTCHKNGPTIHVKTQEGCGTIHESTIKMTTYCMCAIKPVLAVLEYYPYIRAEFPRKNN